MQFSKQLEFLHLCCFLFPTCQLCLLSAALYSVMIRSELMHDFSLVNQLEGEAELRSLVASWHVV